MQRRNFIRLTTGGIVAAAILNTVGLTGCAPSMPADAIEAWRGPAPDMAEKDVRKWLLSYAILAPHSHNLQSWIVDLTTPNVIVLRCDLKRLLPQTDPLSRQIMMSQGTFLEMLDLAAKERGLRADITLFPEGIFGPEKLDNRPVARIHLTPDATVQKDPLFAQMLRRHTNRNAYDPHRPVPAQAWQAMAETARQPDLRLGQVDTRQSALLDAHRKIAAEAWRIELTTPRTIMESYDVLRVGADEIARHRDGLSLLDTKVVILNRLGLFDRSNAPAPDSFATTSQIEKFSDNLASTPSFLWMVTKGNDRLTQVNAGRAYARVQLSATVHGLAMQPLSQALQEYPEQQKMYSELHALVGATQPSETVQMWARVGYAEAPSPSPRRPLEDFITL